MHVRLVLLVVALTFAAGCRVSGADEEEMYRLASALTKLSAAVEATVRYEEPPPGTGEQELLRLATQHDPSLLRPFENYFVRAVSQGRHAVILLCTKDKTRGLIEDAGCSAKLDAHLWQENLPQACEFTTKINEICATP